MPSSIAAFVKFPPLRARNFVINSFSRDSRAFLSPMVSYLARGASISRSAGAIFAPSAMVTARLMRFSSSRTFPGQSIKGKPRLCKIGHARLRKALYMPALVSIQCNPVMIAFYNRLKDKGKNGKVIVCAIMRKLVHIIFGILKSGKKYDPNFKPALV